CFILLSGPLISTLFPYTTLFRSMWMESCGQVKVELPPRDFGGRVETRPDLIREAAAWLEAANRPVIFAGLGARGAVGPILALARSEEHTSELQSRENLVCRLLLE